MEENLFRLVVAHINGINPMIKYSMKSDASLGKEMLGNLKAAEKDT
jgi:hypothetical protein